MEKNTILNADCIEGIKQVPMESVDLIITDPPYNIAHKRKLSRKGAKDISFDFGEWDYFESEEEYLQWADKWIKESYRTLTPDGHLFVWQDKLLPLKKVIQSNDFEIRNIVVWIKSNPVPQFQKVNFLSSMEFGIWATKKDSKRKNQTFNFTQQTDMHNAIIERMEELSEEELMERVLSDFLAEEEKHEQFIDENGLVAIRTPIVMGKERLKHPTQKPLSVTDKLVKLFTNEGDTVMDLFMGSGTVAESSIRNSRDFYGFEKDATYHQMSLDRIAPFFKTE